MFELGNKDPLFRSKIDIAESFIRKIAEDSRLPRTIVADSWYGTASLIELAYELNLTFICEPKPNRDIYFRRPDTGKHEYVSQDELLELIHKYYPHKIKYAKHTDRNGNLRSIPYYQFESRLKDCHNPVKVVAVLAKLFNGDESELRILFSTDLRQRGESIINLYRLRWGIERTFAERKELFYFDQYQSAKLKTVERYWMLTILAWTLAYWLRQCGPLTKIVSTEQKTLADTVRSVRALLEHQRHLKLVQLTPQTAYRISSERAANRAA